MAVLDIANLAIEYETKQGPLRAVDGVDIAFEEGETLGIVGESGCGKSTLAKSLLGLLDDNGEVVAGEIRYENHDLAAFSEQEFRKVRWTDISYIAQNAMNALDPVYRIRSQFVEVMQAHIDISKSDALDRAAQLMSDVGLDESRLRDYPHELSGGQRQRVVIALALALDPSVIIADEPTTGLDVVVQDSILQLISEIQADKNITMIFISHDISAIAEVSDRVGVMYGGRLVELGATSDVFKEASHPYTMGLRNAFPSIDMDSNTLVEIAGTPPNLISPPAGCRFADRCPFATAECETEPPLTEVGAGHRAKCHYTSKVDEFHEQSSRPETWEAQK